MSTLTEALNRKIILTALLSKEHNPAPITSRCSFISSPLFGLTAECGASLDKELVDMALDIANGIGTFLPPGAPPESLHHCASLCADFEKKIKDIAQCMLCDNHRSMRAVDDLASKYWLAISRAVTTEEENVTRAASLFLSSARFDINKEFRSRSRTFAQVPTTAFDSDSRSDSPINNYAKNHPPHGQAYAGDGPAKVKQPDAGHGTPPRASGGGIRSKLGSAQRRLQQAMVDYERRWTETSPFDDDYDTPASLVSGFPWPMPYVHREGATEHGVRSFYRTAIAVSRLGPREYCKREKLKWHPDRIDYKFKGGQGKAELKKLAGLIFRTLAAVEEEFLDES